MVQIFLLILILLLPVSSEAAYTIYLKNGSEISGVSSYEKKGGEVIIYFGGGSIGVPEKDIVKIESTEAPEKDFTQEKVSVPETEKSAPSVPSIPAEERAVSETADRANKLQADLDAVNAELRDVEDRESTIKAALEERTISRPLWNPYQYGYLQRESEPLQQELSTIQQKKAELLQRKAYIEGELKSLK